MLRPASTSPRSGRQAIGSLLPARASAERATTSATRIAGTSRSATSVVMKPSVGTPARSRKAWQAMKVTTETEP